MPDKTPSLATLGDAGGLTVRRPLPYAGERPYLATADVYGHRGLPSESFTFHELPARAGLVLMVGDVLQAKMAETDKAVLVSSEMAGWLASTGFAQFAPDRAVTHPQFLYQWLQSWEFLSAKERLCVGSTQRAINQSDLAEIRVSFPDFSKQRRIAEILSTVDDAIEQTEALIAKSELIKVGLMNDLFTRGVTADGQLRPPPGKAPKLYRESPLGRLPKQWDISRIGELASVVTSGSRGWAAYYAAEGALFVRSQNVREGYLDFSDRQHVAPPVGSEGQRTRVFPQDLLVTITGNNVGNVACVPAGWVEVAFVSQHVGLVRLLEPGFSGLIANFLSPGAPGNQQLVNAQYGQSKPGLNLDNLRDLQVPVPRRSEGEMIAERLAEDQASIELEAEYLGQLQALKRGLLSDLLTGRVPGSTGASGSTQVREPPENV